MCYCLKMEKFFWYSNQLLNTNEEEVLLCAIKYTKSNKNVYLHTENPAIYIKFRFDKFLRRFETRFLLVLFFSGK